MTPQDSADSHAKQVDRCMEGLRAEILDGRLKPGDRVGAPEAADRLGTDVEPVCEALRILAAEGWVVADPESGYHAAAVDIADFEDTCRMRLALDPMATELAVSRMGTAELRKLSAAFEDQVAALGDGDEARYVAAHRRFHFALYGASGSPWLVRFIGMLWEHTARYERLHMHREGLVAARLDQHREILDACISGEPARAAALMREHLDGAFRAAPEASSFEPPSPR